MIGDLKLRGVRWLVLIAATCFVATAPVFAAPPKRLNVLWICADDHAAYVLGAYGNRRVQTPNLDRLAAGGMRFDRAFCNSPVCTASRQSFITGRYPRTLGVTQLNTPLPAGDVTLAELLGQAGYQTAAFGKMHFNSRLTHGFEKRLDLEDFASGLAARGATKIARDVPVQPRWRPFKDPARIWLNAATLPVGAVDADMSGTYFATQAGQFLNEARNKPFFLFVSFYEPHSPFNFPIEHRGRFDPKQFDVASVEQSDEWQIPAVFRDLTPREKQGIAAAYYTSVAFLDQNVGRVLAALEKSGQADNTLVIYTGDHGYLLGQHGRFEKHCSYEEAIRAPLLIRCPGQVRAGSSTGALVEFIDILPTVLDFCGVPTPANIQGRSLRSVLTGRTATHRPQVFVEYAPNDEAAVRDDQWKLIYERGQRRRTDGYDTGLPLPGRKIRLYDVATDPSELTDVAARPENRDRVQRMLALLAEHLRATAREPAPISGSADVLDQLDTLVQPHDVGPAVTR
ncbi:MAG TPA: sulfatase-like hydrolase/transferase [Planctomycetaceae bacterium]|nr:sulfatase-like hydrolase/transferase [Planctomycetaceae bacterium]